MLNLSDKTDQLQKEVGWSIAEMNVIVLKVSVQKMQIAICHELQWHHHQQQLAKMT